MTEAAVLVTGASSGIGQSTVRRLVARGFTVFAGARHASQSTGTGIDGCGRIIPLSFDITLAAEVEAAAETVAAHLHGKSLAGVVNCAGAGLVCPLELVAPEAFLDLLHTNVVGQLRVTQAFLPLLQSDGGRLVFIGSTSGTIPGALTGAYSASKFALEAMVSVLRVELAMTGVLVTMIDPGMIATRFWTQRNREVSGFLAQNLAAAGGRYVPPLEAWRRHIDRMAGQVPGPERVARIVEHVLTATRVRDRYVVGNAARIKMMLWRMLPDTARKQVIARPLRDNSQST